MLLSKTHIPQIDDSWSWSRLILSQLLTWFRVTHVRTSWSNSHNMMIKSASKLKYQQHSSLTLPCKVCYWNEVHSSWWEVTQHFCLCAYPHLSHELRQLEGTWWSWSMIFRWDQEGYLTANSLYKRGGRGDVQGGSGERRMMGRALSCCSDGSSCVIVGLWWPGRG